MSQRAKSHVDELPEPGRARDPERRPSTRPGASAKRADPNVEKLATQLRTVHGTDPERLLRRALEALLEVGEAEEAHFYRPVTGRGRPMTARSLHVGSEKARAALERFHAKPPVSLIREMRLSGWDPVHIKPEELADFVERKMVHSDRELYESALFHEFFVPGDLLDYQRLLVAQGGQLAGGIALLRRTGSRTFDRADRHHLRPLVAPIAATVAAAARLDPLGPDCLGDLVVRSDGAVEFASADAKAWLAFRGFGEALRCPATIRTPRQRQLERPT